MTVSADSSLPYLRIANLDKSFGSFQALSDVSLDIHEREFVCFLGPSGCGKTTLLRAIAGLDPQTDGTIHQGGRNVSRLPPAKRDFGIVFQSYALFPNLTVERNIAYGLENRKMPKAALRQRVEELLDLIDLRDQAKKYPAQLSGGQQQRVALARALAPSPGLLLLDEPLSALDAKVRSHLRGEIRDLQRRLGITTIMVTHDQEEGLTMADRIVVMNQGRVEQVGTPMEIYRRPATAFVADFIGTMNFVPAHVPEPAAQGMTQVDIGARRLLVRGNGVDAGSRVRLAIRPEDIVVHGLTPETPGVPNLLTTEARHMEFLGSFYRAHLTGGDLGETVLKADLPVTLVRRQGIAPGASLAVTLPPEHIRLYPTAAPLDGLGH